jgi:hypothetical protein
VYKRQIAFGGAASAAFLVAGIFGAGTAFASTATTTSSALISSLPAAHSVPMISGDVAPAGRAVMQHLSLQQQSAPASLAPVTSALPGLGTASGIASAPNMVSSVAGQDVKLSGVSVGGSSLAGAAQSATSGQIPGMSKSVNSVPGASAVTSSLSSALGSVTSAGSSSSVPLSGATGSLGGVSGLVPGVSGLANGQGLNGNLPVG